MTSKQFMKEFKSFVKARKVALFNKTNYNVDKVIRFKHRGSTTNVCYCPITYVARVKTGKYYGVSEYDEAAKAIGLKLSVAKNIVAAADNENPYKGGMKYRKEFLKICVPKENK